MISLTEMARRAQSAPIATLDDLAGPGNVLALAPHPDDESLAMGGAIAAAAASGRKVHVVVVTDGTQSHPNSHTHPAWKLARLRRREFEAAVKILTGNTLRPVWLGYPDMAAPESSGEFDVIGKRLAPILGDITAIWTTWNGDPHPDHQRVWRLGRWLTENWTVRRFYACPVWGRVQCPVPGAQSSHVTRFPTHSQRKSKSRAIAAHASQMTGLIRDDPLGFRMPEELIAYFVDSDEIFIPS